MKFESHYNNFHSRKGIWKYRLQNGGHFVRWEMSLMMWFQCQYIKAETLYSAFCTQLFMCIFATRILILKHSLIEMFPWTSQTPLRQRMPMRWPSFYAHSVHYKTTYRFKCVKTYWKYYKIPKLCPKNRINTTISTNFKGVQKWKRIQFDIHWAPSSMINPLLICEVRVTSDEVWSVSHNWFSFIATSKPERFMYQQP